MINILEYLEKNRNNQCALADEYENISYEELILYAKKIGSYIINRDIGRNQPIAVYIDRNIWSIVAFLGIVYSGNFYIPIDPTMPEKRVELILNTLSPKLVISTTNKKVFSDLNIDVRDCINCEIDETGLEEVKAGRIDTDPLYAIFTSGSTGVPKGVLVSHRSVIDLVEQFTDTFSFPELPIFGNQAPLDFDVSVKDIYCSMKLGGTVQLLPKKLFSMPAQLIPYLNDRKVNVIIWAVSAMRIVSNYSLFEIEKLKYLKLAMFSGEVMPIKTLNDWRINMPEVEYVNLYGPTEITCNCSYYILDREFSNEEVLPIGKAFKNTQIFLLDDKNCLIEKNMENKSGEICVKGSCLSLGYYNNWEKTKEAFVQNPLNPYYPEMIYRTGDLGYYKEDGMLYFTGRKDYQIKHMGHRIELGEIEATVNAIDYVEMGCCIYDEINEKIYLCYQSKEERNKQIIKDLSKALPKFMWPQKLIHFTDIPMNKNGKMDRVLLKDKYCK